MTAETKYEGTIRPMNEKRKRVPGGGSSYSKAASKNANISSTRPKKKIPVLPVAVW